MSYLASDGRVYSHRESRSEYLARHRRSGGGGGGGGGDSSLLGNLIVIVILISLIRAYWQYVLIGALIVVGVICLVYSVTSLPPKWRCPICGVKSRIKKVTREKVSTSLPLQLLLPGSAILIVLSIILFIHVPWYPAIAIGLLVALIFAAQHATNETVQFACCRKCKSAHQLDIDMDY